MLRNSKAKRKTKITKKVIHNAFQKSELICRGPMSEFLRIRVE